MDAVTHILIGGIAAQLPGSSPSSSHQTSTTNIAREVSWRSRAIIGAGAAIFPDIDYLLFWINPLDFLAYWHRAETHSLVLAPLWALLISFSITKLTSISNFRLVFIISLIAILSHSLADSLTIFGTRWFAPFSDIQISWDLLFVIDPYFTLSIILSGTFLYFWRAKKFQKLALLFPFSYLLFVFSVKYQLTSQVDAQLAITKTKKVSVALLPQPFSPLFWQALTKDKDYISQAYIKLSDDSIASAVTSILEIENYGLSFTQTSKLDWRKKANLDNFERVKAETFFAWNQPKFKAFHDFSHYPVFLEQTESTKEVCFWFSDLRYHWPGITPSFRYAMCRDFNSHWYVKRLKYFSSASSKV
ncbi:MAG: metal-dependent hydrolase [Kangiellaceae bacterium]|nr:metal-dependent hydrolase [Kangiellaceae bacterium]MCW9017489.1 metal-dependent hydrolase [Kangiellaceae bacterium]